MSSLFSRGPRGDVLPGVYYPFQLLTKPHRKLQICPVCFERDFGHSGSGFSAQGLRMRLCVLGLKSLAFLGSGFKASGIRGWGLGPWRLMTMRVLQGLRVPKFLGPGLPSRDPVAVFSWISKGSVRVPLRACSFC